jgi:hypothetical protein
MDSPANELTVPVRESDNIRAADLKQILQVLDLAARRGAFVAEEFAEIGTLYLKLKRFVEHSALASNANRVGVAD